ncbi:MAG: hypothetical protein WB715_23345 [Roseiarcus sp.]|uniref:hypothetical protein n=1 Tax=Roseiarcus sp. TaxID=1969460 RepID=UPI003C4AD7E4
MAPDSGLILFASVLSDVQMPRTVQSQAKNLKGAEAIFLGPSISRMSEILQERTLARVCFLEKKKQVGLDRNGATLSKDEDLGTSIQPLKLKEAGSRRRHAGLAGRELRIAAPRERN